MFPALGSTLSRQMASAMFIVFFALQFLLVIPAYKAHREILLQQLESEVRASIHTIIESQEGVDDTAASRAIREGADTEVFDNIERTLHSTPLRGGLVYSMSGEAVSWMGEPLYYQREELNEVQDNVPGHRMELYWSAAELGGDFGFAARIDTSSLPSQLAAYLWKAIGVVFLSTILICLGGILVVNHFAIMPLLALRSSLLAAGSDPANASEFAPPGRRQGVIGDVSRIIKHLLQRVSQTFREELATFAAMVEQSGEGILAYNAEGTLVYANRACLRFCGATGIVQLRKQFRPRFRLDGEDEIKELKDLLRGDSFSGEADLIIGGEARIRCLISAKRIKTEDGRMLRTFASLSDISQIRKAQWEVEQKNVELEEANRIKAEFLAQMSHELRTPLNAIIGFSEILTNRPNETDEDDQVRMFAGDINSSGHHLLGLINDILDLSKLEAGKQELSETETDLVDLSLSALAMLRETASRNEINLSFEEPVEPMIFTCDAIRIKQVLLNLLSNAVKFTDRGGSVTLGFADARGAIHIFVRDTGIGMNPEDIPKALQPFAQVDSGYNRRYDGTGLGLPICSGLVELHGGKMSIESERGKGTTVSFTLPLSRRRSQAA